MSDLGTPTNFKTTWVIVACAVVLIGWDIYAAMSPTQPTISALVLGYAHKYTIVPFGFGVLMGHFFWSQTEKPS
jgi:hypothetical protein